MDLAVGAKRVFIVMQHTTRDGKPRVLKRCTLPITAKGVVKLLVTDLGLFEVTEAGLLMREIAPGYAPEEVQELTDAHIVVADGLKEMEV